MHQNIGFTDQALRIAVGVLLLAFPLLLNVNNTLLTIGSVGVGVVLIGSALITFCPLYKLLGINTYQE